MFTDFVTECRKEAIKAKGAVDALQQKEHVLNEFPERIAVAV